MPEYSQIQTYVRCDERNFSDVINHFSKVLADLNLNNDYFKSEFDWGESNNMTKIYGRLMRLYYLKVFLTYILTAMIYSISKIVLMIDYASQGNGYGVQHLGSEFDEVCTSPNIISTHRSLAAPRSAR